MDQKLKFLHFVGNAVFKRQQYRGKMRLGIICDQGAGERPLSVATVSDRQLLLLVAKKAIQEAASRVSSERDSQLSLVRRIEFESIRATLEGLIPELRRAMNELPEQMTPGRVQ